MSASMVQGLGDAASQLLQISITLIVRTNISIFGLFSCCVTTSSIDKIAHSHIISEVHFSNDASVTFCT